MTDLSPIEPGFPLISSDGTVIGHVDTVQDAGRIRLRPPLGAGAAAHDFIPSSWVSGVENDVVRLNRTEVDARSTMNHEIPVGTAAD
ncbi:MAG: DUF2171 domain-containing protein [Gluconacetobacter diazotrophicus]|nr:DUF2171 domain-containing protein [Gluconacetobacter diazotrophicus]